jgi:hypothetical protein
MEIQVDTDLKINSLKKKKENTRRTEILKNQNFLKKIYSDYKSKKIDLLTYLMQTRTNKY